MEEKATHPKPFEQENHFEANLNNIQKLYQVALHGNIQALSELYLLGEDYFKGSSQNGIEQDHQLAFCCFSTITQCKPTSKNKRILINAYCKLVLLYTAPTMARSLPYIQCALADIYKKLVPLYTSLAISGDAQAQINLSAIYSYGKPGINPQPARAAVWLSEAAQKNYLAQTIYKNIVYVSQLWVKAINGDSEALYQLGLICFSQQPGIPENTELGQKLLLAATQQKHPQAKTALENCLKKSISCLKSMGEAILKKQKTNSFGAKHITNCVEKSLLFFQITGKTKPLSSLKLVEPHKPRLQKLSSNNNNNKCSTEPQLIQPHKPATP